MFNKVSFADQKITTNKQQTNIIDLLVKMNNEMLNPVNTLIELSTMLMQDAKSKKHNTSEIQNELYSMYNAGNTLLSIVNAVLCILNTETGKVLILPVNYNLPDLINDVISTSVLCSIDRPAKFILDIDESIPDILQGDVLWLRQILNSLLENMFERI